MTASLALSGDGLIPTFPQIFHRENFTIKKKPKSLKTIYLLPLILSWKSTIS
jgi:hypothetical protein